MREGDGKMLFVRDRLVVRRGEQIRFVIENAGEFAHDFVVANTADNLKHAACRNIPTWSTTTPTARRFSRVARRSVTAMTCRASVRRRTLIN